MFTMRRALNMCFGKLIDLDKEGIKTESLSTFLASSLNVELLHIILKGIKKFSNIRIEDRSSQLDMKELNNLELMRICKLNRIKIKNPEKWDKAKYDDFVGNQFYKDAALPLDFWNQERSSSKVETLKSIKSEKTPAKHSEHMSPAETMLTINEEVTIFEYAPQKFQDIREMDKIDRKIIKISLSAKRNRDQAFQAGESQGKSGSFFFFSHDRRFIFKTMNDGELQVMLEALPDYHDHLMKNPHSLLARIYGMYKVKMEDIVPVNLLVMANTNRCQSSTLIMNIYDLKGSVINRERKWSSKLKNTSTLKDINLIRIKKKYQAIGFDFLKFKHHDIDLINEALRKDIEMLKKFNLMDYSLLLCVEHVDIDIVSEAPQSPDELMNHVEIVQRSRSNTMVSDSRHKFYSSCGNFIYHVSIIDYLQAFNFEKWQESRFKIYILRKPEHLISAVDPEQYAERFLKFMKTEVFVDSILELPNLKSSTFVKLSQSI